MATPLTDRINSLTSQANAVTEASDTNLSDAVNTLIAGYGGGAGSVIDNLLEVVSSITPTEDTMSLEFPCNDIKTGMYIIVSNPPGTRAFASQQSKSETINMTAFDVRGITGGTISAGSKVTINYLKTPSATNETDWWTAAVTLDADNIRVNPASGRYPYLAGVTYYLLRVKGA